MMNRSTLLKIIPVIVILVILFFVFINQKKRAVSDFVSDVEITVTPTAVITPTLRVLGVSDNKSTKNLSECLSLFGESELSDSFGKSYKEVSPTNPGNRTFNCEYRASNSSVKFYIETGGKDDFTEIKANSKDSTDLLNVGEEAFFSKDNDFLTLYIFDNDKLYVGSVSLISYNQQTYENLKGFTTRMMVKD